MRSVRSCGTKARSRTATSASCRQAEITARSSASSARNLSAAPSSGAIPQPLDPGIAPRELFLEPLVTAIQVIDAIDNGFPGGGEAGDDQRYRGPQIGRHDRR